MSKAEAEKHTMALKYPIEPVRKEVLTKQNK